MRVSRIARRACGAVAVPLVLAACASGPRPLPDDDPSRDAVPSAAYLAAGSLVVEYATDRGPLHAVARWPAEDVPGADHRYRVAWLELPREEDLGEAALRARQPVRVAARAEWDGIVEAVLRDLAPAGPDEAALTLVQDDAIVFHVTDEGALRVHRALEKPAELRVSRVVGQGEFAARADAILRDRSGGEAPVLFPTGDAVGGESFVLFDFARRESVLIATLPAIAPGDVETTLALLLHVPRTLVVEGHVLGVVLRPVSSIARLLWLAQETAEKLVPRSVSGSPGPVPPVAERPGMDLAAWERSLDDEGESEALPGSIEPLIGGETYFTRLVQAVLDARESVCVRLYIFDSDEYALRIADVLKYRSREIEVRVLIDALGSLAAGQDRPAGSRTGGGGFSIASYLADGSGVEVRESPNPWFTSDHTKTVLVDGRLCFLGGMNVGREYRYEWHDMMAALEGPVVGRLQHDFDLAWAHAGLAGDLGYVAELATTPRYAGPTERADFVPLRPLYTRTFDAQILRVQLMAMERAQSRIWVEQPYVAEDVLIAAMIAARERGVDVRLVVPTRGDSGFMNGANLLAADALMRRGVRVYVYPGMTHVKAALYDGWACLGSANFDKLSLRVNRETDIATSDPVFAERLARELFEKDFARAKELTEPPSVGWDTYVSSFVASQL